MKDSRVLNGLYCFYVDPADQILFRHQMARLLQGKQKVDLVDLNLTLTRYHKSKTRKQENMYRKIVRVICTDENSEAYGSEPDLVHEGILARACLSYGYPTDTVAGMRVPVRSSKATTKDLNLLMEVARVLAGELNANVSHIGTEE